MSENGNFPLDGIVFSLPAIAPTAPAGTGTLNLDELEKLAIQQAI